MLLKEQKLPTITRGFALGQQQIANDDFGARAGALISVANFYALSYRKVWYWLSRIINLK